MLTKGEHKIGGAIVVRFPEVASKCCDVAREEYDVEKGRLVRVDMRNATSFQIIPFQVSINLTLTRSSDRKYYLHAEVNAVSIDSAIIGICQLTSSRSPKITEQLIWISQDPMIFGIKAINGLNVEDLGTTWLHILYTSSSIWGKKI